MKPLGLASVHSPAGAVPGVPAACANHARELARFEWWTGDPGDPASLVAEFLARHGLGRFDPGRSHAGGQICGAALLISAAGGAAMHLHGDLVPVVGATRAHRPYGQPLAQDQRDGGRRIGGVPDVVAVVYERGPRVAEPEMTRGRWALGPWQASWTRREHADAVQEVRAAIGRGDVYQVNIVGHASASYSGDPSAALARVAAMPGARYGGTLHGQGWAIACASPETLLELRHDRLITRPIKGTAPATVQGAAHLRSSLKERAEHIMIVDLERNDLSRVAVTGSVRWPRLFAVRRWSNLWQAESDIEARLRPGVSLAELLRAMCPGGSVTGAPKIAALKQIARLEPVGRGPSMGAFGWIGPDSLDLGLSIRTVAVDGERIHLWAGGGITIDSDPLLEVAEAEAKAGPIRAALRG